MSYEVIARVAKAIYGQQAGAAEGVNDCPTAAIAGDVAVEYLYIVFDKVALLAGERQWGLGVHFGHDLSPVALVALYIYSVLIKRCGSAFSARL